MHYSGIDHHPFGMLLVGRTWQTTTTYKYGFNGKENVDDVYGNDVAVDFGARIYDGRVGRFLSIDPLSKSFADVAPYGYALNSPITLIDLDGLKGTIYIQVMLDESGSPVVGKKEMAQIKKQLEHYYRVQHNIDIKIEISYSNNLFSLEEFKARKNYDVMDSYVIIGKQDKYLAAEKSDELKGWETIGITSESSFAGRSNSKQFYTFIDISNIKSYYDQKGFKDWTEFLFKTIIHETSHPKFRFHPANNTSTKADPLYPNEKYVDNPDGVTGHVEGTVMDDTNTDISLDNYMISLLQMLHGQVKSKQNTWESGTAQTESGEVLTNRDLISRDVGLISQGRTDNK